jgi:glutamine synthetase
MAKVTVKDILEAMKEVDSAKIFFTDLNGRIRNLAVNPKDMGSILEKGIGFDASSIAGMATVDDSDRILKPVVDSFKLVNTEEEKFAFFSAQIVNSKGERSRTDPRYVLERVLEQCKKELDGTVITGPEHEFFLLSSDEFEGEDSHTDKAGYFHTYPYDTGEVVRNEIVEIFTEMGLDYEKTHHEVTASQHEINFPSGTPLEIADRTVLFNYLGQVVAARHGMHFTLMPKPFDDQNRNAFHIHCSIADSKGNNLFYSKDGEYGISQVARQFFGGIIKYARQSSIILASTYNSYKAYVASKEAPVVVGWGMKNRSSLARLPHALSPKATRVEIRCPDPAGNPYLQIATVVAMGLQGVREKLDIGPPDSGSTYKKIEAAGDARIWDERFLPKSMYEALVEAERSDFLKELLGERMYKHYMKLKLDDWEDHRTHITPKEHEKYLRT